jgi:hypothetical protein
MVNLNIKDYIDNLLLNSKFEPENFHERKKLNYIFTVRWCC